MKRLAVLSLMTASTLGIFIPTAYAQNYSLNLSGRECWTNTGIYVNQGDTLHISAIGRWSNGGERPQVVGPEGFSNYYHASAESNSFPFASLIGRIENTSPFFIGSHETWVVGSSRYLLLTMNDVPGTCNDNSGVMAVNIDRQPNSNADHYHPDQRSSNEHADEHGSTFDSFDEMFDEMDEMFDEMFDW